MNEWWILLCIAILAAVGVGSYHFGEDHVTIACDKHDEAQQQVTIAAQTHVIGEIGTQGNITQESENAYHSKLTSIDSNYVNSSVQQNPATTGTSMRAIPNTACGVQATKVYKLTPLQCDHEEAKANALWNWANKQAAVK